MKVLLINPPNHRPIKSVLPEVIEEERGYNPPLGIMYLASYARKHTFHQIELLDCQVEELSYKQIEAEIKRRRPDVVGITVMTFSLIDVLTVVKIVKTINPKIKIVLGGPHAHIFPEETIVLDGVDFLVLGEGEFVFRDLLENINDKRNLKKIKGLVFIENGKIINTGKPDFIENLDALPHPARDLLPISKYSSVLAKRSPVTTMFTSRGCPHRCIFCDRPNLGKKFRARSALNVVEEMEECLKMGIREFFLYDDTFGVDRQRVLKICDHILKRNLKAGWDIRTRVDTVDEEILRKLKTAGCERIHFGIESGNPEILKTLQKGITIEQARRAFRLTKKIGIETLAYFMIGNPGETKKTAKQTIRLAKELEPDYVHFSVLIPFPATKLYWWGLERGIFKTDFWREFARNPQFG
jgi:anaerobic magnesium-protoporphyrin IX monomethyl ester cyclase